MALSSLLNTLSNEIKRVGRFSVTVDYYINMVCISLYISNITLYLKENNNERMKGKGFELVKVEVVGICGTDIALPLLPFQFPQSPGHEILSSLLYPLSLPDYFFNNNNNNNNNNNDNNQDKWGERRRVFEEGTIVAIEINASHGARIERDHFSVISSLDCPFCQISFSPLSFPSLNNNNNNYSNNNNNNNIIIDKSQRIYRGVEKGMEGNCPQRLTIGMNGLPGGFSSYLIASINSIIPLPSSTIRSSPIIRSFHIENDIKYFEINKEWKKYSLTEPFAAALHAVIAHFSCFFLSPKRNIPFPSSNITREEKENEGGGEEGGGEGDEELRVGVVGPRRLGLLILLSLIGIKEGFISPKFHFSTKKEQKRTKKKIKISAIGRHSFPLKIAKEILGIEECFDLRYDNVEKLGGKFDIVYDTTGSESGFSLSLKLAKRIVHLKSTSGRCFFGCKNFTPLVVDELSLLSFSIDRLHFRWNSFDDFPSNFSEEISEKNCNERNFFFDRWNHPEREGINVIVSPSLLYYSSHHLISCFDWAISDDFPSNLFVNFHIISPIEAKERMLFDTTIDNNNNNNENDKEIGEENYHRSFATSQKYFSPIASELNPSLSSFISLYFQSISHKNKKEEIEERIKRVFPLNFYWEKFKENANEISYKQKWGSVFPRYDVALISCIKEADLVIRPQLSNQQKQREGTELSLLIPRSAILLCPPNENSSKESSSFPPSFSCWCCGMENELEKAIWERDIQVRTSRCGDFKEALSALHSFPPSFVDPFIDQFISKVMAIENAPLALSASSSSQPNLKVLLVHDDHHNKSQQ